MIPVTAPRSIIILAHRGGGDEAPENTITAFRHTRSLGLRHIETDAHLTADGVVVLNHDPTVDRCYDGSGLISQMTWHELSQLRNEAGEQMPLLGETLEAFPDMYFNIDAKVSGVEGPMVDVIEEHGATGRVLVASFSERRLRRVRERTRMGIATSLGTQGVVRLVAAAQTGTSPSSWGVPGLRHGVAAVQVPTTSSCVRVVDRRFVAAAHTAGLAVHVWTIDDLDEVVDLMELGVDGIITNRPRAVRDLLVERGLWFEPPAPSSSRHPRD
ncbi:glycerophosphodiester phosphodiesterase [Schaalia sp. ZJ405]|uniref:glycerophosphodiester phosphodiesterase n=1 Tax=unclassified Schaalia TaxID=2691889 RepID=UPI0013EDB2DD|nr:MULTISPECIES: glycerophosphodiester phosphodiesterase [unclassified Schaalia]QPK80722.1 glycerophosphodiester phosphodiesterase [Schaalia sp. ZJ405]